MWHINLFTFYKAFWQELTNGTVLDLIVICEKKGTIKYSNKIDEFSQIAELCEFEANLKWPFSSVGKLNFCVCLRYKMRLLERKVQA